MLGLRTGEYVMIGEDIKIRVMEMDNYIRLGIEAPRDLPILRQEKYESLHPEYADEGYRKSPQELAVIAGRDERRRLAEAGAEAAKRRRVNARTKP